MITQGFESEITAARWLEHKGYRYAGHLHEEPALDFVQHQTTAWVALDVTEHHRAELAPTFDLGGRWTVTLLSDGD